MHATRDTIARYFYLSVLFKQAMAWTREGEYLIYGLVLLPCTLVDKIGLNFPVVK